jgi:hypothetical protein
MKTQTPNNKARGQACVELAMILPILVLLVLGVYDFACAMRANNIISNMSREGANLAARSTLATQDIMNALALTAQPLNMKDQGMIYITALQGTGATPQIQKQDGWDGSKIKNKPSSRIGSVASAPAQNLGATFTLSSDKQACVIEVFYNYQSLFSSNLVRLGGQLYSKAIFSNVKAIFPE